MGTEELLLNVVFYLFAIGAVVASIAVALSTNIIRSAFALLGVLFGVAAMYAFMRADFVVAAQIIIYVGGILVLIIFAVMLTHKITDVNVSNESAPGPAAVFAVLCVLFALCVIIATRTWDRSAPAESLTSMEKLAGDTKPTTAMVNVTLLQGDGTTGVLKGGEVRSPFVVLRYEVTQAPSTAEAAHFALECSERIENQPDEKKRWAPWSPVKETTVGLTNGLGTRDERLSNLKPGRYRWTASFVGGQGTLALAGGKPWTIEGTTFTVEAGLTRPLGVALMSRYLLPFELISVLLLAALVGAAYIARKEVKEL